VSLYSGGNLGVQLKDHATFTVVTMADANFAKVFALRPVAGRLYTDADAKHAVLVSERFARDNFGEAQAAVGQVLGVEGEPQEIVGVVGDGFDYPNGTQVWMASPMVPESRSRTAFNYKAVALLRGDASFRSMQAELNAISQRLQAAYAKENKGKEMVLQPLKDALTGDSRATLMFLWAAAGLILLIACVNAGAVDGAAEGAGDTEGAGLVALEGDAAGVSGEPVGGVDWRSCRGAAGVSDGAGAGGDGSEGAAAGERDSFERMGAGVRADVVGGDGDVVGDVACDARSEGRSGGGVEE
jgi:hypothetical protein